MRLKRDNTHDVLCTIPRNTGNSINLRNYCHYLYYFFVIIYKSEIYVLYHTILYEMTYLQKSKRTVKIINRDVSMNSEEYFCYRRSQSGPGLTASALPENVLEIQVLGGLPQGKEAEILGVEPSNLCFNKPYG